MHVTLHFSWWGGKVLKRIPYGLVVRTDVEGYEMQFPIVPNPPCRGYLGEDVPVWIGKVAMVRPSRGSFPQSEQLLHLRLLHEGYRGV